MILPNIRNDLYFDNTYRGVSKSKHTESSEVGGKQRRTTGNRRFSQYVRGGYVSTTRSRPEEGEAKQINIEI